METGSKYCWHPWVKKELEKIGFEALVSTMPETETPRLKPWLARLQAVIGEPDEQLFLVGHSVGGITILRYLESLSENIKISGVVLVAGFTDDLDYMDGVEDKSVLPDFFQTSIDWEIIKSHARKFVASLSDDDPFVELKHAEVFREKLGAEIVIKHDMKHFSGLVDDEASCIELPEVVKSINQMLL